MPATGRAVHVTELPAGGGGMEQYLPCLTRTLAAAGWAVTVICATPVDDVAFDPAVNVVAIPGLTSSSRRRPELDARLEDALLTARPDLVHLHLLSSPAYVRHLSARYPTVLSVHNHFLTCPSGSRLLHGPDERCGRQPGAMCMLNAYLRRCGSRRPQRVVGGLARALAHRSALHDVRRLVVDGPFMKSTLVAAGIAPERISIVPSLPPGEFTPGGAMAAVPTFLFAGRLVEEKGVHVALRALARVPAARLVIAGEGYFRPALEGLVDHLGLGDRVSFAGRLRGMDLVDAYRRSWAVLVPSTWPEPFGMTGLEAMMCARAVVGFDSGDIGWWLRDGVAGRLVPWNDVDRLVDSMREMTDRGAAVRYGERGREEFESRFGPERHWQRLEAVYREVSTGHADPAVHVPPA
jgi:glycosyltransferase involved in cell wall biosynthesis